MSGARWSLRRRLVAVVIGLLAAVATVIGVVSTLALRGSLLAQLDNDLLDTSQRAASAPMGGTAAGPFPSGLEVPGQRVGTVQVVDLGSFAVSGYIGSDGQFERLSSDQVVTLLNVPADGTIRTVGLGELGAHRVVAVTGSRGARLVTGLSTAEVNATVGRHVLTTGLVALVGLTLAGLGGTGLVRRELRPLGRVAATASRVAALPLDRGEVLLAERVPAADTDPGTEVGRVGAALNLLLGHVESALTARQISETQVRQFVADASHELRTPLASIRGYAELVRHVPGKVHPDVLRAMERVESEAKRMTALVEDLLLLARLDAGRQLERAPVDMTALAADAVADAHAAGPDHIWRLELPVTDDDARASATVLGDDHALRQVLANLLANARVHTPAGTIVTTSVHVAAEHVTLSVKDDGPGIPPAVRDHLFDRFSRGDSARSPGTGSAGLGLAIADAVVRAHGAQIAVDGTPGATTFTVTLDCAPPD